MIRLNRRLGTYAAALSLAALFPLTAAATAQVVNGGLGVGGAGSGGGASGEGRAGDESSEGGIARADNITTMSIAQFVRLEGQAESQLRGIGLVTGLRGTGDSGSESVLARPLAELYKNNGNPIPQLKDLAKAKNAAIVFLWANIPEQGGRKGDKFDLYVKVGHTATSLEGGMLEIAWLLGPKRDDGVYASASGLLSVENPAIPTVAKITGGVQLTEDITMKPLGDRFNLIVRPYFRGWSTTSMLAQQINDTGVSLEDDVRTSPIIARAVDETIVEVTVPEYERADPATFIASLLDRRVSPELMRLPAMVICNERTGVIVATSNVEISAVSLTQANLLVSTTTPPPVPTPQAPLVNRERWVPVETTGRASERAKVQDLLAAFKRLDVPVRDQIEIFKQIARTGRLHARLIIE